MKTKANHQPGDLVMGGVTEALSAAKECLAHVCTGNALRCLDGNGCECEMAGNVPTDPAIALHNLVAALSAQPRQDEVARDAWLPIETAPKEGQILLSFPRCGVIRGRWEKDSYGPPPRPYWTNDRERMMGKVETRGDQPTHWMALPAPPAMETTGGES